MIRMPDRYADSPPERHRRKWDRIILAFMEGDLDKLRLIQRTGSRGRIFYFLVEDMLQVLGILFRAEPIFDHIPPNPWYIEFAREHDLKLRENPFYNPDFFLENGGWLEVTLSENSAYKKVLRYGHQAKELIVLWLDEDQGLHKSVCQIEAFPNAKVQAVEFFYHELEMRGRKDIIEKLILLKELKGILL